MMFVEWRNGEGVKDSWAFVTSGLLQEGSVYMRISAILCQILLTVC